MLKSGVANLNANGPGRLLTALKSASNITSSMKKNIDRVTKSFSNAAKEAGKVAANSQKIKPPKKVDTGEMLQQGATAIGGISAARSSGNIIKDIATTGGNMSQIQSVYKNALQSEKAGEQMFQQIQRFAEETPYELDELSGSFLKLVNRGIIPTKDQMTNLGDLASSQAKPIDMWIEAILDAQMMEFERLKEFGIKARKAGNQVTLDFKGQTKTIKATADEMYKALLEFGAMDGVAGSMAVQMNETNGIVSNMSDSLTALKFNLYEANKELINGFLKGLNSTIEKIGEFLKKNPALSKVIFGLIVGFTILTATLGVLALGFLAVSAAASTLIANPVLLAIAAVILAIAAAVMILIWAWQDLKKGFEGGDSTLLPWLDAFTQFINKGKDFKTTLVEIKNWWIAMWDAIKLKIQEVWQQIKPFIDQAVNLLLGALYITFSYYMYIIKMIYELITGDIESLKQTWQDFLNFVTLVWELIWLAVQIVFGMILEAALEFFNTLVEDWWFLLGQASIVLNLIAYLFTGNAEYLKAIWNMFVVWFQEGTNIMIQAAVIAANKIAVVFVNAINSIIDAVINLVNSFGALGGMVGDFLGKLKIDAGGFEANINSAKGSIKKSTVKMADATKVNVQNIQGQNSNLKNDFRNTAKDIKKSGVNFAGALGQRNKNAEKSGKELEDIMKDQMGKATDAANDGKKGGKGGKEKKDRVMTKGS